MQEHFGTCPLSQRVSIDEYFCGNRSQVLEIAAFLDRPDRHAERDGEDDFRLLVLRRGLEELCSDRQVGYRFYAD